MIEQPKQTLTSFIKSLPADMSTRQMFERAKRAGWRKTTIGSIYAIRNVLGITNPSRSDAQKAAWTERKGKKKPSASAPAPSKTPESNALAESTMVLGRADLVFLEAVNEVGLERATFLVGFIRSARAVKS